MGEVWVKIRLVNALDSELLKVGAIQPEQVRMVEVNAMADSGARLLALPESIAGQLGLREVGRALVTLGDGTKRELPLKGYVLIQIELGKIKREAMTQCLVGPDDSPVLLGQVPLEVMDLVVDCPRQRLVPSVESSDLVHMTLYTQIG